MSKEGKICFSFQMPQDGRIYLHIIESRRRYLSDAFVIALGFSISSLFVVRTTHLSHDPRSISLRQWQRSIYLDSLRALKLRKSRVSHAKLLHQVKYEFKSVLFPAGIIR